MSTPALTASGIVYLAKRRPIVGQAADGQWQLSLLAMDRNRVPGHPIDSAEAWLLIWRGPQARQWWTDVGQHLQPGQPLFVRAAHMRTHSTRSNPPLTEIHAHVISLCVAPTAQEARDARAQREAA